MTSSGDFQGPLAVVAAAVTPVVMISATAILISGVTAKHSNLADRIRALTAEHRAPSCSPERRRAIDRQVKLLLHRVRYVSIAHVFLYCATALFITMVLQIGLSETRQFWQLATLPTFLAGVLMLLVAVIAEICELLQAAKTIRIEVADTFEPGE